MEFCASLFSRSFRFVFGASLLLVSGCTQHRPVDVQALVDSPTFFPAQTGEYGADAQARTLNAAPWWTAFEDRRLNELVETAFQGNLDLKTGWARLKQAQAQAGTTRAAEAPQANLSVSSSRSQIFLPNGAVTTVRNSVAVPMSFEADVFGKLNAATDAAELDALASRSDIEALALSLSAEIAQTYFDLLEQRQRHQLLGQQLETGNKVLSSLKTRYTQGQSSSLDYYQQEQLVKSIVAQQAFLETETARLANQLTLLLGVAPGEVLPPSQGKIPSLPPLPALGLPADLLNRRPDVQAALERLQAADRRVAQSIKDRLPSLSLSLSLSYQDSSPSGLFRNLLRGFGGEILTPLLDGGRRRATIDLRRAQVEERILAYQKVFLVAMTEVNSALAQEKAQSEYLDQLIDQQETAKRAFQLASDRYQEGVEDFIRVLSGLQTLHQVQLSVLGARGKLLRHRVQLCRALGGSWTSQLKESDS